MIAVLAVISIVYGALVAMAQSDFKKLIAYSSVNHMGYVMLGFAAGAGLTGANAVDKAIAVNGAILQMFNHGIITGALFLLVGVVYERSHNRDLSKYGGLWPKMPVYGADPDLRHAGLPGTARPGRLRQRVHGLPGRLPGLHLADGDLRHRHHRQRGLPALDDPAHSAGRAHRVRQGALPGPLERTSTCARWCRWFR